MRECWYLAELRVLLSIPLSKKCVMALGHAGPARWPVYTAVFVFVFVSSVAIVSTIKF